MAKKNFILQGVTPKTHAQAVRELFDVSDIKKVILSVAFVSESGVQQIEAALRPHADRVTVFAGIRNDITSQQGLALLHDIGVNLYTVDTGSRTVIFHPKLYLVRGKANARFVVGSANLTLGGLNNNIEAGMMIDFTLANAEDKAVVDEIEAQLTALPADYPEHVVRIGSVADLDVLLASGRLVDEMAVSPPRPTTSATGMGGGDTVPRMKLKVAPLRRALAKAKAAPKKPKPPKAPMGVKAGVAAPKPMPATVGIEFELVWESKPLTRRDLTIPDAKGTHATGSVNLDKGLLPEDVDHRHYFRDDVFPHLAWATRSKTVDEAFTKFQLVMKGISHGEFDLAIRHTTSTTSEAYKQRNAMTRLSWGPMREYVARPDLIGRTLALYRDKVDPTRFVLEID
ncbi:MAG: phospholipase D family protein [Betaproteobacteria bacterium]|nr:phospholipase D family protein [Betaproteobacteria bacterium]